MVFCFSLKSRTKRPDVYTEEYCKSVLVTGGVGFIGSHVVETLLKEGRKVVVYDIFNSETTLHDTAKEFADIGADLSIVHGDIRDQDKIIKTIKDHGGITGAIHVGGMVDNRRSVTHPSEYIGINIRGTAMLASRCFRKMWGEDGCPSIHEERLRPALG